MDQPRKLGRPLLQGLSLGALLLLALWVRLVDSHAFLAVGGLLDQESHLNARRMTEALRCFPALPPVREPLFDHPHGVVLDLPPGLPYLGAAAAWLAGLTADGDQVGRLGTLLGALFGALGAVAGAWLTWRYVSLPWAFTAGLVLALWPAHVEYTRVGRLTPLVLMPLLLLLAVVCCFRAVHGRTRHWIRPALLAGLLLGAMAWVWAGALLPITLLGLGLAVGVGTERPVVPTILATALLSSAPLCLAAPGPRTLHLLLFLAGMLATALVRWLGRHRLGLTARTAAVAGAALLLVVLPLLLPGLEGWRQALGLGGLQGRRSLIDIGPTSIVTLLTYLPLALPLLVGLACSTRLDRPRRVELDLLTLWAGALLVAGVIGVHLMPLALALAAPLCGLGAAELARRLVHRLRQRARWSLVRLVRPATGLGVICLLWPAADYLTEPRLRLAPAPDLGPVEAAARLRGAQAGAVMAPLETSATLVDLAHTATVGTVAVELDRGNRDTATFFTLQDQQKAWGLLHRRAIRQVMATPFSVPNYATYLRLLGRRAERLAMFHFHRRTMAVRLFHDLGTGVQLRGEYLPAINWLQHWWESRPRMESQPTHLFRVVEGARLEGLVPPHAVVILRLDLVTGRGRPFEYQDRRRANARGEIRFRLPYWSARAVPLEVRRYLALMEQARWRIARGESVRPLAPLDRPDVTPLGQVQICVGADRTLVDMPRHAVLTGATVRFRLRPAAE